MWDKDKPQGSTKIRYGDDAIRDNNAALESAFSEGHDFATGGGQTGKHTTPTFKDNGGAPSQPTGTNELIFYNNGGLAYFLNQAGTKRDVGPIPSGTVLSGFKQSAAPAGWTFKAEDNDRALINTSTEADGGATGGSWTVSGFGGSTDGHTLSTSEMPSHDHKLSLYDSAGSTTGSAAAANGGGNYLTDSATPIRNTGGNGSHSHGISDSNMSHDGSWRPSYVKCITCEKQ